jgi:hypothetical protein
MDHGVRVGPWVLELGIIGSSSNRLSFFHNFLAQRTLNFQDSHTLISPFARSDLVSRREHEERPLNLSGG